MKRASNHTPNNFVSSPVAETTVLSVNQCPMALGIVRYIRAQGAHHVPKRSVFLDLYTDARLILTTFFHFFGLTLFVVLFLFIFML